MMAILDRKVTSLAADQPASCIADNTFAIAHKAHVDRICRVLCRPTVNVGWPIRAGERPSNTNTDADDAALGTLRLWVRPRPQSRHLKGCCGDIPQTTGDAQIHDGLAVRGFGCWCKEFAEAVGLVGFAGLA